MPAPHPTDSVVKVKEAIQDKLRGLTTPQLQQVERFIDSRTPVDQAEIKKTA